MNGNGEVAILLFYKNVCPYNPKSTDIDGTTEVGTSGGGVHTVPAATAESGGAVERWGGHCIVPLHSTWVALPPQQAFPMAIPVSLMLEVKGSLFRM